MGEDNYKSVTPLVQRNCSLPAKNSDRRKNSVAGTERFLQKFLLSQLSVISTEFQYNRNVLNRGNKDASRQWIFVRSPFNCTKRDFFSHIFIAQYSGYLARRCKRTVGFLPFIRLTFAISCRCNKKPPTTGYSVRAWPYQFQPTVWYQRYFQLCICVIERVSLSHGVSQFSHIFHLVRSFCLFRSRRNFTSRLEKKLKKTRDATQFARANRSSTSRVQRYHVISKLLREIAISRRRTADRNPRTGFFRVHEIPPGRLDTRDQRDRYSPLLFSSWVFPDTFACCLRETDVNLFTRAWNTKNDPRRTYKVTSVSRENYCVRRGCDAR